MKTQNIEFIRKDIFLQWIAEQPGLWQMHFLPVSKFTKFAKDRGIKYLQDNHIILFWQTGLLHSDIVKSRSKLTDQSFQQIHKDENRYYYSYTPPQDYLKEGWLDVTGQLPKLPDDTEILFHPFRYYVIYQLVEFLKKFSISFMQPMIYSQGLQGVATHSLNLFKTHSRNVTENEEFLRLNRICDLIIATEPCIYTEIFHYISATSPTTIPELKQRIEAHWSKLIEVYQQYQVEDLEKIRGEICISAEKLDSNKILHILIRLANRDFRKKLKGDIGGCSLLLTMAETLRRATERAFEVSLREEDELGFGVVFPEAKKSLYASDRVTGGERNTAQQFLNFIGLDYNVRLRWYVEGDTELGALQRMIGESSVIQIINLRGSVAEKKRAAFLDSLQNDCREHIFSFISVDGDAKDDKAIEKAAEADLFCGKFFVSKPDFELANFLPEELAEVLWDWVITDNIGYLDTTKKDTLLQAVHDACSGKDFFEKAKNAVPELSHYRKSKVWGEKLMEFALERPEFTSGKLKGQKRPIMQAVDEAWSAAAFCHFLSSHTLYKVDPKTGKPIPRQ